MNTLAINYVIGMCLPIIIAFWFFPIIYQKMKISKTIAVQIIYGLVCFVLFMFMFGGCLLLIQTFIPVTYGIASILALIITISISAYRTKFYKNKR